MLPYALPIFASLLFPFRCIAPSNLASPFPSPQGINLTAGKNEGNANIEFNLNNLTGRADRIDLKTSRSTQSTTTTEASYKLPLDGDVDWPLTLGYFKDSEVRDTSSHTQHTRGLFASYNTYSEFGEHNMRSVHRCCFFSCFPFSFFLPFFPAPSLPPKTKLGGTAVELQTILARNQIISVL